MKPDNEVLALLDKAKKSMGTDAAVARALDVSPQRITNWRTGNAPCSPENQALIAAIAGLDPVAELARATVRKHEGTAKGDMLMKALGKASLLTGAVIGSVGASAHQIFSTIPTATSLVELGAHWMQCAIRLTQCAKARFSQTQSGLCQPNFG